jgi:hypothetical protein
MVVLDLDFFLRDAFFVLTSEQRVNVRVVVFAAYLALVKCLLEQVICRDQVLDFQGLVLQLVLEHIARVQRILFLLL